MINVLSYLGMSLQSEVCLWALLGLLRTIFDATLFKVNANLKQVWQMSMPAELSTHVQRILRTMVSGVMLVQCFTVYVYLASYIVLLYPVFLEERPTLVLPWLLLAAIRKLLCELLSLAMGLGVCVLLGPARPPCIKFVVMKVISIMPAFYMWMLLFSYYHALKISTTFKTFAADLPSNNHDYGLELAVRRRRTKSLFDEEQLRKKLISSVYGERSCSISENPILLPVMRMTQETETVSKASKASIEQKNSFQSPAAISNRILSDTGTYEDWFGNEVSVPRDADRILEQFILMMLRIGAYIKTKGCDPMKLLNNPSISVLPQQRITFSAEDAETPPHVGSSREGVASYLREYPQIFMKKVSESLLSSKEKVGSFADIIQKADDRAHASIPMKRSHRFLSISPDKFIHTETEKLANQKVIEALKEFKDSETNTPKIKAFVKANQSQTSEHFKTKSLQKSNNRHSFTGASTPTNKLEDRDSSADSVIERMRKRAFVNNNQDLKDQSNQKFQNSVQSKNLQVSGSSTRKRRSSSSSSDHSTK